MGDDTLGFLRGWRGGKGAGLWVHVGKGQVEIQMGWEMGTCVIVIFYNGILTQK